MTSFSTVIEAFLGKITDDMYMEISKEETEEHAQDYIVSALPYFEFPRVDIYDYDLENGNFNVNLSGDEVNIIATYMVVAWVGQQLASVENTRMKYSGSDYKFTSQANHMNKLLSLKSDYTQKGFHLQRVYKRRKYDDSGLIVPTMSDLRLGRTVPSSYAD